MTEQHIIMGDGGHYWRTELPNIVFSLGLSPHEFLLYSYYKRVAGDRSECFQTQSTIAENTGMSVRKIRDANKELRKPRDKLGGKSLIRFYSTTTEHGDSGPNQILIVDIWPENSIAYADSKKDRSGTKCRGVRHEMPEGPARNADKEEPYKKNPNKNPYGSKGAEPPRAPDDPPIEKPKREQKVERAEHVATTDAEHERLVADYGEAKVAKAYQKLSEWKADTPRGRWKKCDNRSIRRWVMESLDEEALRRSGAKPSKSRAGERAEEYRDLW